MKRGTPALSSQALSVSLLGIGAMNAAMVVLRSSARVASLAFELELGCITRIKSGAMRGNSKKRKGRFAGLSSQTAPGKLLACFFDH